MDKVMTQELDEQLSAFVDGELDSAEAALLLKQLGTNKELLERVRHFQLIGSSLRREPVVGAGFIHRVHEGLDAGPDEAADALPVRSWRRFAAGGAMAASVALIALAGLNFSLESNQGDSTEAAIAGAAASSFGAEDSNDSYTVPTPAVAAGSQVLVEPRLVNYMMRHGQLGPVITRTNIQAENEVADEDGDKEADVEQR